jgi:hypothetical protein
LVNALLRLTEIEAGAILVDGHDIANISLRRLRTAIAIVPQTPFLFEVRLCSLVWLCPWAGGPCYVPDVVMMGFGWCSGVCATCK